MSAAFDTRPAVASYCATFLKPEMFHIYRQISGLSRVRPIVIAQKRENAGTFPFEPIYIVGKPATHFLRRFLFRQLLDQPWQISRLELEGLLAVLERTGAQLLHIYFGHIAVHLLPLIKAWDHPMVVSFHGADVLVELEKPAYRAATREMLRHVHRVFVRSESLGRAIAALDCEKEKIEIVRTAIPLDRFPFRPRTAPEDGRWQLLQAGRLIEKKGIATSMRAFARFTQSFPEATFIIAGEGPLLYELEDLADSLKIHDRVSFRGFVKQDQLRDLFYGSHIFLHPSQTGHDGNQEGVPNSMLEAMATGLPVFATNHGGIPEAIENGISGILVSERDDESLAHALLTSAKNPEVLSRFARAGAEAVAQKFEQRAQLDRLEDLYLETIRAARH